MPGTRGSLWLRWPDPDTGPLWAGLHLNERAGETVLVGVECWTEAPGAARTLVGPASDPTDDLLPWPAIPLRASDLAVMQLETLMGALRSSLAASNDSAVVREASEALRPHRAGRPPLYGKDHFALVAGFYLKALDEGSRSPTLDVSQAWGVSQSTASRWVRRARVLRLLAPA